MNIAEPSDGAVREEYSLRQLNWAFLAMILAGLVIIIFQTGWTFRLASAWLWALAMLTSGALLGLLFGIPRMRQTESAATKDPQLTESSAQPEINNNLIEISDWLTKIIVGLGLVELKELPSVLHRVANPLAACMGPDCGYASAVALVIFFLVAGFLGGYINSRTVIARLFRSSDDKLLRQLRTELQEAKTTQAVQEATADVQLQGLRTLVSEGSAKELTKSVEEDTQPDNELIRMAEDYEKIRDPKYSERVALKDRAASKMLQYVLDKRIPKETLLKWIEKTPRDGLIVAFASYVLAVPEAQDIQRLLKVSSYAKWLHVKFRIVLAFRQLFKSDYGTEEEWQDVLELLDSFYQRATVRRDVSLLSVTSELMESIRRRFPNL